MNSSTRRTRRVLVAVLASLAPVAAASPAAASGPDADHLTPVPHADPKIAGRPVPNKLSRQLAEIPQAAGADLLEGADPGIAPAFYGYDATGADSPLVPIPPATAEAQKTEPDKNTYLVLDGQTGADPGYDYGHAFPLPGPRGGAPRATSRASTSTRIAHRVTLLAVQGQRRRATCPTSTARPGTPSRGGCSSPPRAARPAASGRRRSASPRRWTP